VTDTALLEALAEPRSDQASVEELTERRESSRELTGMVARLPEPQRVAVVLRHVAGLSIAEALGHLSTAPPTGFLDRMAGQWAQVPGPVGELDRIRELARARVFYLGSDATGIVCFPTCHHARRIAAEHQRGFRGIGAAVDAGYRPCQACRPGAAAALGATQRESGLA
jgi:hypothetical protein